MAKPTNVRVEYSYEATINIGNFQNVKPGYKVSGDVPEGESPSEVLDFLEKFVESRVDKKVSEIQAEI